MKHTYPLMHSFPSLLHYIDRFAMLSTRQNARARTHLPDIHETLCSTYGNTKENNRTDQQRTNKTVNDEVGCRERIDRHHSDSPTLSIQFKAEQMEHPLQQCAALYQSISGGFRDHLIKDFPINRKAEIAPILIEFNRFRLYFSELCISNTR